MGANPNIFINKENRRVVPPEEENFFVSAEEFKAIDTAFATKADQSSLDSLSGSVSGLSSLVSSIGDDLDTAETDITNLQSSKENVSNKATDFSVLNDTLYPTTQAVDTKIDEEIVAQLPQNHPTQLALKTVTIDGIPTETAIVSELEIPLSGTVLSFTHPASFGSFTEPITTATLSFTDAVDCVITVFLEAASIPSQLDPAVNTEIVLPWSGDAFSGTVGNVNVLQIRHKSEPVPQNNILLIANTVVNMGSFGVDPELKAYFKFEESVDLNVIIDQTNYSNDGAYLTTGALRGIGKDGNAHQNNNTGITHKYAVPYDPSLATSTNSISGACWINLATAQLGSRIGIASMGADSDGLGTLGGWFVTRETTGKIRFRINGNATYEANSVTGYDTGETWMHIGWVFNGTTAKIYINGVLDATDTFTEQTLIIGNQPLYVAGIEAVTLQNVLRTGSKMDEFKFWTKEVLADEMLEVYNEFA